MRPPAATLVHSTGNLTANSESIKMGVDVNNIEHLLMLLTDLYSDQILAILREYSTNAWDSHVDAGVTRPIDITLPSQLNPVLKVRDYGTGLSLESMRNVYSQYGSSTKRGDNDSNGMFGIGCKSALTYSQQFTVTSICNGTRITALVSRVGSAATMNIIDTRPSTEHNGVEISVPVKTTDVEDFRTKAAHLYSFWKKGTVLVNGSEPAQANLKMVTDRIGTTIGDEYGHDIIVMGNVPYPVGKRLYPSRGYSSAFNIVAFVDIGDVNIPPNREAVMYTEKTEATIKRYADEFAAKIRQTIVDDIDSQPTHMDAFRAKVSWESNYPGLLPNPVQYKGVTIPDRLDFQYSLYNSNAYSRAYSTGQRQVLMGSLAKAVMIYDFPGLASLSKVHKEKIRKWKDDNSIQASVHLLTTNIEGRPWIDESRIVSWDVIKKIVLPNANPGGPRKVPTIDIYNTTDGRISTTGLDATKIPVYVSPTARIGRSEAMAIYAVTPDIQIVSLGANRWDKFIRENPKALSLNAYLRQEFDKARDALTPTDLKFLGIDQYEKNTLSKLESALLDDPDLADVVRLVENSHVSPTLSKYISLKNICYRHSIRTNDVPTVSYIDGKYPLLSSYATGTLAKKHLHLYLNAVYADSIKP